jgi:hypothetical protein
MVLGQLIAAVFACLTSLTATIGDAWSESKWPMDGQDPAGDGAIYRISEAENVEIVSCEAVSIKSLQFTRSNRLCVTVSIHLHLMFCRRLLARQAKNCCAHR